MKWFFFLTLRVFLILLAWKIHLRAFSPDPSEEAIAISHQAVLLPEGTHTYEATLSTRTAKDTSTVKWGAHKIRVEMVSDSKTNRIRFKALDDESTGAIQVLFQPKTDSLITVFNTKTEKPIQDLQQNYLDTVFTLEDLSLQFLGWKKQELNGMEEVKGRSCWKITGCPDSPDSSAYSKVIFWIDQEYKALIKAESYNRDGILTKEFNIRSFQKIRDIWTLKSLELKAPILDAKSRLDILDPEEK